MKESQYKIGDIVSTNRDSYGDEFYLCNGEYVSEYEFPEYYAMRRENPGYIYDAWTKMNPDGMLTAYDRMTKTFYGVTYERSSLLTVNLKKYHYDIVTRSMIYDSSIMLTSPESDPYSSMSILRIYAINGAIILYSDQQITNATTHRMVHVWHTDGTILMHTNTSYTFTWTSIRWRENEIGPKQIVYMMSYYHGSSKYTRDLIVLQIDQYGTSSTILAKTNAVTNSTSDWYTPSYGSVAYEPINDRFMWFRNASSNQYYYLGSLDYSSIINNTIGSGYVAYSSSISNSSAGYIVLIPFEGAWYTYGNEDGEKITYNNGAITYSKIYKDVSNSSNALSIDMIRTSTNEILVRTKRIGLKLVSTPEAAPYQAPSYHTAASFIDPFGTEPGLNTPDIRLETYELSDGNIYVVWNNDFYILSFNTPKYDNLPTNVNSFIKLK